MARSSELNDRAQPLPDLGYDFKAFTVEVSLLGKLRAHTEQIATVASASLSASPTAPSAQDRATSLHDSRALELLRSHTTGDPQLAAPSRTFVVPGQTGGNHGQVDVAPVKKDFADASAEAIRLVCLDCNLFASNQAGQVFPREPPKRL